MPEKLFIGREKELSALRALQRKNTANLVIIKGRRRIGKSRLAAEFGRSSNFLRFQGLAPETNITDIMQRRAFAERLAHYQIEAPKSATWTQLFQALAEATRDQSCVILLDEISWLAGKSATFVAELKNIWDFYFSENPNLVMMICGSISTWIDKNILSSTAFVGRISKQITLTELPINDAGKLLTNTGFSGSAFEQLMLLSVTGGIPWYLEQVDPHQQSKDNIKSWCFKPDGFMVREFKAIFHDLFDFRGDIYESIVKSLVNGPRSTAEIAKSLNYHQSGTISEYLQTLQLAGFIQRDRTWQIKDGKPSSLSHYRLSDNYTRFYLRYIEPKLDRIERQAMADQALDALPGFNAIMGLQFENLVLSNRQAIWQALGLNPGEIVADNPFFQRKTKKQAGCQIDYLIQTDAHTLFACEVKFSKQPITPEVIHEMQQKLARLKLPKGYAAFPVLIHAGMVSDAVLDADYFRRVIDLSGLINTP